MSSSSSSQRVKLSSLRLLLSLVLACIATCESGSVDAWHLQTQGRNRETLERESTSQHLASPVQVGAARYSSQIFNGRFPENQLVSLSDQTSDLFQCVDPSRNLFDTFTQQYNRDFQGDSTEKLERFTLFATTLKRTIMLNRIIQNEILNQTNYDIKQEIGNYHFVSPTGAQQVALWYADITDCELGLIKYILFDLFYLIDRNELAMAYRLALDNSANLPLLSQDGFEQLANILLVRLYDRFKGDDKMNQLFQWPKYIKKLAGYAYNRRQISQPDFNSKLALISFVYPSYFKDVKYNAQAVNRTTDNLKAHHEHEKFNKQQNRKFSSRQERNKRLAVFRQRMTLLNLLHDDQRWQNITIQPDWLRVQQNDQINTFGVSEKLRANEENPVETIVQARSRYTRFADLTDTEFVAFITNDFSLLGNSKESAEFIDTNFPIRPLDETFRNEIASELELRRAMLQRQQLSSSSDLQQTKSTTDTFRLARQVIDELISDVGLPMGSVTVDNISEDEYLALFSKISSSFGKTYANGRPNGRLARLSSLTLAETSDQLDERQLRYQIFKENYGRFKAWFVKENWNLDENQLVAMLRLADMRWPDIKVSLFKICCLTEENLASLSSNATIQYLGSNDFLCQQLSEPEEIEPVDTKQARELAALELYYYYSIHFNKHHSNMDTFNRRFFIFKRNIDDIKRHSCTRGLTLYRSLKLKRTDSMSTIDELDPRRSFTDDINLDRYEYFSVPNLNAPDANRQSSSTWSPSTFDRLRAEEQEYSANNEARSRDSQLSRAGISYRRDAFFGSLLQNPERRWRQPTQVVPSIADKLTRDAQDYSLYARKYRQNNVDRIYGLVMQRYKYCMRTVRNLEIGGGDLKQQCQSSGPLRDQASELVYGGSLDKQLGGVESLKLQEQDPCAFYRLGLEPWAEGLIKQDLLSAQLIQTAKC